MNQQSTTDSVKQAVHTAATDVLQGFDGAVKTAAATELGHLQSAVATPAASTTAPAPATAADLSAQEKAAVQSLADQLSQLTGQAASDLVPFATVYGPDALKWAALEAKYKQSGDHPDYVAQANNLAQLRIAAIGQAAELGLNVEAATEAGIQNALMTAGRFAIAAAVAAL